MNEKDMGYITVAQVIALRRLCKPKKIRVVWDNKGRVNLYFPSGRKLKAGTSWDLEEIHKAIESGEIS